ncbi:hypothetical protein OG422_26880 [Streptomyces sp. NBC_01525]|uniref:hypothetical protein n=1 Tax=Streptomyces sp. NBC_01525 TaxID=2903893 RepID=UPI0038658DD3
MSGPAAPRKVSLDDVRPTVIGSQSFAARIDLGLLKGVADPDLLGGPTPLTPDSRVFASIAEYPADKPGAPKFMGSAKMSVLNLVPYHHGVLTRIFIDWPQPLAAAVDFLVIND